MLNHTAGPWQRIPDPGSECEQCGAGLEEDAWIIKSRATGGGVAVILTDARANANARLIEKAPQLLAASCDVLQLLAGLGYTGSIPYETLKSVVAEIQAKGK